MAKAQLSNKDIDSHCTAVPLCIALSIYSECLPTAPHYSQSHGELGRQREPCQPLLPSVSTGYKSTGGKIWCFRQLWDPMSEVHGSHLQETLNTAARHLSYFTGNSPGIQKNASE